MENLCIYEYLEGSKLKDFIKVGDIIYVIPSGNSMRFKDKLAYEYMEEYGVTKVGRKYFWAKRCSDDYSFERQFEVYCGMIKDKSEYSAERIAFLNKADFYFERAMFEASKLGNCDNVVKNLLSLL